MNILQYVHYFIRSIWYRGFLFTCKLLYYEFRYEKKFRIRTLKIENLEELDTLSTDYDNNHHYQGASYYVLSLLFDKMKTFSDLSSILDYGCGKGRVIVMAAYEGYKLVSGVDLARELIVQCQQNIERVRQDYPATKFEVHFADATSYSAIDEINHFFFFNPFGRSILIPVIEQIKRSAKRNPREIHIIYVNPLYVDCFADEDFRHIYSLRSKNYVEATILQYRSENNE